MIRCFTLAAILSAAASAAAWGQAGCDDMRKQRMDAMWEQAAAAFDAGVRRADETYREEFQTANDVYAEALARVDAAYEGTLYWAVRSAKQLDHSSTSDPIADAAVRRAYDRNAAHREWASSVSDTMSRWSASMEQAETRRSAFIEANVLLIEKQLSDCR